MAGAEVIRVADVSPLIANERCKAWSTNLTRLGSGALAYVVADIYVAQAVAPVLILPVIGGLSLYWLGRMFLGLLQVRADMIELSPTAAQAVPGVAALAVAAFAWLHYRRAKEDVDRRARERELTVGQRT